jgi:protein ImuA
MTASRSLQLAAEGSGSIGLALRRWRFQSEVSDFGGPTAAMTRWRVSALPSTPLPVPGIGRARWGLDLIRCRGGGAATFELEACDTSCSHAGLPTNPGRAGAHVGLVTADELRYGIHLGGLHEGRAAS